MGCGLLEGDPSWRGDQSFSRSSGSMTSVRLQSDDVKTAMSPGRSISYGVSHGVHGPLSPILIGSVLSQASDQPSFTDEPPLTPTRSPGRYNRHRVSGLTVSHSPTSPRYHGTPGPRPVQEDDRHTISDLHPDLAAVRLPESRLSKEGK